MSDIKGINLSYCTHKILIEDEFKPVIQPQRRLNPKVQDVVKNEIVKLLDSGLIYPISDSSWVSPIHVVPNKGGMTVVLNDNNELIPSRTVIGWRDSSKSNRTRGSRKDNIHLSLWDFCLPKDVVWVMQSTSYLSKMHDGNFPRHSGRLYRSIHGRLLGFNIEIKNKRGADLAADHLLRLENPDLGTFTEEEIADEFLDKHFMALKTEINNDEPWYADYVNYLVGKIMPPNWTPEKRNFFSQVKNYFWDESYAFKLCLDNVMRRCVAGNEIFKILAHCHSGPTGGHHSALVTERKVYKSGFFWPSIFKNAKYYVMRCDACQRSGNILSRKIEHKAYWVLKQCNMDLTVAAKNHFIELNELIELRDGACENTRIYKERTKKWHDSRLRGDKDFKVGDMVLLFNSRFKMNLGKLKSRWYDPNVLKTVYPYGTMEIIDKNRISFKVNGQRLKKYHERHIDTEDKEVVEFEEDTM
ncbi:reverse transcriptase domain-containing protein [Tanacetum coccineum]